MNRVLIVEDSQDMRRTLTQYLEGQGFAVQAVDSTEDGIDAVDEHDFDIGLIDINLPGKSGFSMIEYIRDQGKTMPLIALTARGDIDDKLKGFDMGATDYIVKPFNLQELAARMRAQLQHAGPSNLTSDITTASYCISPERHSFTIEGKEIELTNIEFRILHALLMHHGSVVTTTDLIEFVWGESHTLETPPVRIHIANVRRKLKDTEFKIIRTIPGIGYKLDDPAGGYYAATA
ncbi:MAG TPA: response regulator transcription factor [Candidatus Saccharimonadales bacterium]|jgi:two-component system copper resistance phosphate regulon response regulator CusR